MSGVPGSAAAIAAASPDAGPRRPADGAPSIGPLMPSDYRPGACNIGPAEIARRRRVGHVGLVVTGAAALALVAVGAPPALRAVVAVPAMVSAAGYLQAWLRFCAAFGSRGVANFGELGPTQPVLDPAAAARDRVRAWQIGLASLAIGVAVGLVAAALPR